MSACLIYASEPAVLEVVSGLIVRDCEDGKRRGLFIQRAGSGTYPFAFASPGGKIEPGETEFGALLRELREEIGVDGMAAYGPWSLLYEHFGYRSGSTTARIRLRCFYVVLPPDAVVDARPLDGVIGLAWLSADDVVHLPLALADAANRNEIDALLLRELDQI